MNSRSHFVTPEIAPPTPLAASGGVRTWWSPTRRAWIRYVSPGSFYVSGNDEVVTTLLGSCVSMCLWESRLRIGGLNHFLLPVRGSKPKVTPDDPSTEACRYGVYAMERLINEIVARGGRRELLRVKIFGGASVLSFLGDIGRRNVRFARRYLEIEGLPVEAEDVGGNRPRRLEFHPESGRIWLKRLSIVTPSLVRREEAFLQRTASAPHEGTIELF